MTNENKKRAGWIPKRRIAILQALTALVAIGALVFSVVEYNAAVTQAQHNTCSILRVLVLDAATNHHTAAAKAFIAASPLAHC